MGLPLSKTEFWDLGGCGVGRSHAGAWERGDVGGGGCLCEWVYGGGWGVLLGSRFRGNDTRMGGVGGGGGGRVSDLAVGEPYPTVGESWDVGLGSFPRWSMIAKAIR